MANKSNTPPVVTKREYSLASAPFGVDGGRYSESTASGVCSRINTTAPAKGASAPVASASTRSTCSFPNSDSASSSRVMPRTRRAGTATCVSWVSKVSNTSPVFGSRLWYHWSQSGKMPAAASMPSVRASSASASTPCARIEGATSAAKALLHSANAARAVSGSEASSRDAARNSSSVDTPARRSISSEASLRYRASTPCVASERATRDASSSTVVYARAETSRRRRGARRTPGGGVRPARANAIGARRVGMPPTVSLSPSLSS